MPVEVRKGDRLAAVPTEDELSALLGEAAFDAWRRVVDFVERNYEMDVLWDIGRKAGIYEKKYRRSGKTLCALYAREAEFGFLVVLGKKERDAFDAGRADFEETTRGIYEKTHEYHDGKWLMLDVKDESLLPDIVALLKIKKKPKRAA